MNGIINNIQRFSLNDGPGIRTTIFFKGCNLRCKWCHNPETLLLKNEILITLSKCIGCFNCVSVCPTGARKIEQNQLVFNRAKCTGCGKCAEICFPDALENTAKKVSVDDVMFEIMQDKAYYTDSKGGVTISGGEVMSQPKFANALVDACLKNDISCAVETNLAYDFDKAAPLLKKLDLIMFDLKIIDDDQHKKWIGLGNKQILDNILKIDELSIPLICRTPLVRGATDSKENISGITEYLSKLKNLQYWELLNFNPLGDSKYSGLEIENYFHLDKPFNDKELNVIKNYTENSKMEIRIS